jgi:hypothetical protein
MSILSAGTSNTTSLVYTGDTTGNLAFQTNGTTEAMRINAAQNVGIGTTNPIAKLDVSSSASGGLVGAFRSTGVNGGYVYFQGSGTTPTATGYIGAASRTNNGGTITDFGMTATTNLVFGTNDGTERMRIDSSGNVGIGTTSPSTYSAKLAVVSSSGPANQWLVGGSNAGAYAYYSNNAQTSSANAFIVGQGWATGSDNICFLNSNGAYPLIFATTSTERFRIASSGETTFTKDTSFTNTNFSGKLGGATGYGYWSNSDVSSYFQMNGPSNASAYNIYAVARINGVILSNGASSWSALSDSRLKNVTGVYSNALSDIAQIEPIKFTWKSDEENKPQVGVIAQSVFPVVPEAIDYQKLVRSEDETEYMSVRYTELIPLMIASIQELNAKVDAQAAEIAALKGNN